jgi:cobalt/nickel transport system permease protein
VIVFEGDSGGVIAGVDPRLRLAAVLSLAVVLYAAPSLAAPVAALGVAVAVALAARVPPSRTWRRLAALNGFLLVLVVMVPLSTPGEPLARWGGWTWSREGAARALRIAAQANAVMLSAFALLATLDPMRLGWALAGLGAPPRLVQLFLFLVRYIEVIHQEYHRLDDALRVRCFTPQCNVHTLKTLGYLVGQLLVRSVQRAERVLAAMRCRGYDGRLHLLVVPGGQRGDALFAAAWGTALLLVGWLGWRWATP